MKNYPDWRFNFSDDWHIIKMKDIISRVSREVEKPNKPYYKLSVRSHAKGTFHQYISDPKSVDMENLYVVHKNDLIVNITFAWEHAIAVANESDEGLLVSHRFPTYIIDKADVNFVKYRVSLKDFNYKLDIISPGGAGRNRVMNQADFNEIKIKIPCIEEQKKIANCLTHFNKALTAQEKKVTNWREVKKGMLQKIFSREFRFKDDNGNDYPDWQDKKLGEICKINPKSSNLPNLFNYIDLESVVDGLIVKNTVICKENAPDRAQRILIKNDIIFQMVRPYQKNNYIYDNETTLPTVSSTGYAQIRSNENIVPKFLYFYLIYDKFVNEVIIRCTGGTYPAINSEDLAEIYIKIPCPEEQKKIADYFSHLDKIVSAESKILESMREMKKGLLQKLFV